ncbi:MAG: LOG family protein, partial [Bacteroidales bacterium]|nr:LOG family protein [Bacteroidales bacterium]
GLEHPALTDLEWTDTMAERKEKMREGVDLVIALPGGIGTMDELFETFTLAKLGQFHGKLAVLNIGGFYDPLAALLDHFVAANMLTPEDRKILHICSTTNEIEALL